MVMPNIGAFIAWGLLTALFIPDGWLPNARLAALTGPMVRYLLPLLLAYSGGALVHGTRGAVVGATATLGAVVGTEIPVFAAAMMLGPLGAALLKWLDARLETRIPPGFEMLANNFLAGILGGALAILALLAVGPLAESLTLELGRGVEILVERRLLPLAALLIEPAKVLFLNNAINHGVLAPLGVTEAARSGKAIHFLLESNPGPGLGLLSAHWLAAEGAAKRSAPGAIVIHFFGGIHEIYFPYVLSHPVLLLAVCAGGLAADSFFLLTRAGLVATPSPGSIFAELAMTPKGGHAAVLGGILIGAAVSFLAAVYLLRALPGPDPPAGTEP